MHDVVHRQLVVGRGRGLHYVGDSALITEENLDLAAKHGITLTARLPRTVALHASVVLRALHDKQHPLEMEELGTFSDRVGASTYEGCVVQGCTLQGHTVQLGVYRPTPANDLAEDQNRRRQQRAFDEAMATAAKLVKERFGCEADARRALEVFEDKHDSPLLRIDGDVVAEQVCGKRPRGCPRKDADVPMVTQYRVDVTVAVDEEGAQAAIDEASVFVLVHTGTTPMTAREMLAAYKEQSVVEKRFPFLCVRWSSLGLRTMRSTKSRAAVRSPPEVPL